FENGSIGTISYNANGSKKLEKEYVEVYSAGRTVTIRDFHTLEIYRDGSRAKRRLWFQDKGHKRMLAAFLEAIQSGRAAPIKFDHLRRTSVETFAIQRTIVSGRPVPVV